MSEFKEAILQIEEALNTQINQLGGSISEEMALVENNEAPNALKEIQQKVSDFKFHYFEINTENLKQLQATLSSKSDQQLLTEQLNTILKDGCEDEICPNCPNQVRGLILSPESLIELLTIARNGD